MYKINTGRKYFAVVNVLGKTYVCPGWHEVPLGTTRDQIDLVYNEPSYMMQVEPEVSETKTEENLTWQVEGSKGAKYTVSLRKGQWDCSCPARQFRRGDCKHIKSKKSAL
jgi:hypothetical protein